MTRASFAILTTCLSIAATGAAAQSIERRVLDAPTAIVRLSFAAREDVCGTGNRRFGIRNGRDRDWTHVCEPGPVRVQFEKDGSRLTGIRSYVGGAWRPRAEATDLGMVSAGEASGFLLDVAATANAAVAEDALLPAALADVPDPWRRLLSLARDTGLPGNVREQALFWLGQSAGREATAGLAEIVDGDETTGVQKAAVFAISQRELPERIDLLLRVARTHPNPEVVRAAFFWLADSGSERAVALFEEVLSD